MDDKDSDARSHPNLKKSRHTINVLEDEDEYGELEDDKDKDPWYNIFFDEDILFKNTQQDQEEQLRKEREEST